MVMHVALYYFTPSLIVCFLTSILYKIKLDGYIYMTNELLMALRYESNVCEILICIYIFVFRVHPSLTCLSCRSSPVITDKGIASLIPCMCASEDVCVHYRMVLHQA